MTKAFQCVLRVNTQKYSRAHTLKSFTEKKKMSRKNVFYQWKEFVGFALNLLRLIEAAVAHQILHCENHVTMAMLNPMLKNPGFMVIMAHWPQKEKFHGCVCVCVCVCVFYVGHPTMSNGPLLCAASCAELLPAVTLTHTNKRIHTAGEILGCPLA